MPLFSVAEWDESPKKEVKEALRVALDTGYRHIDTAYTYFNEDAIGEVLDEYLKAGKVRREDIFIVTKLPMIHMDEQLVRSSLEGSLERLRLSYVDLYLLHAPIGLKVECHLYFPQEDLQELCEARGIKITAYAPLGSPATVPVFKKEDAPVLLEDSLVLEMSKKYKKTPAQMLLRNLMQRGIIVFPKSVTPKRIVENFQVFDFEISEADMKTLANIKHFDRFFIWPFGTDQEEFPFHIPF